MLKTELVHCSVCTSFSVSAVRKHSSVQTEIYWYYKNLWLYCEFC